jgi:hypothetical protein
MPARKTIQSYRADSDNNMARVSESLVDISLIDEMLRMSPEERLLLNDRMIRTIMELRDAFRST